MPIGILKEEHVRLPRPGSPEWEKLVQKEIRSRSEESKKPVAVRISELEEKVKADPAVQPAQVQPPQAQPQAGVNISSTGWKDPSFHKLLGERRGTGPVEAEKLNKEGWRKLPRGGYVRIGRASMEDLPVPSGPSGSSLPEGAYYPPTRPYIPREFPNPDALTQDQRKRFADARAAMERPASERVYLPSEPENLGYYVDPALGDPEMTPPLVIRGSRNDFLQQIREENEQRKRKNDLTQDQNTTAAINKVLENNDVDLTPPKQESQVVRDNTDLLMRGESPKQRVGGFIRDPKTGRLRFADQIAHEEQVKKDRAKHFATTRRPQETMEHFEARLDRAIAQAEALEAEGAREDQSLKDQIDEERKSAEAHQRALELERAKPGGRESAEIRAGWEERNAALQAKTETDIQRELHNFTEEQRAQGHLDAVQLQNMKDLAEARKIDVQLESLHLQNASATNRNETYQQGMDYFLKKMRKMTTFEDQERLYGEWINWNRLMYLAPPDTKDTEAVLHFKKHMDNFEETRGSRRRGGRG